MQTRKKIILGIDPGTTSAIAALDLDGNLLILESRRDFSHSEMVNLALSLGEPVVVASDVNPPSEYTKKVTTTLNTTLYMPDQALSAEEKGSLARSFAEETDVNPRNSHERDALAAAVKAHLHFKNKLRQVERKVHSVGVPILVEEVKGLVVRGNSIQSSIKMVLSRSQGFQSSRDLVREEHPTQETTDSAALVTRLRSRIDRQKEEISRLKERNEEIAQLLSETRIKLDDLAKANERLQLQEDAKTRRERRYRRLRNEIISLRKTSRSLQDELENSHDRLESLREIRTQEVVGETVLLKPVETFTADGIEKASKFHRIVPGDRILLQDASGGGASTARRLADLGISVVVAGSEMSHQAREIFRSLHVPIIPSRELSVSWVEGYPYVPSRTLEEKIKEQRESERALTEEDVETAISHYREERRAERS